LESNKIKWFGYTMGMGKHRLLKKATELKIKRGQLKDLESDDRFS
jgi:hypothetical protein